MVVSVQLMREKEMEKDAREMYHMKRNPFANIVACGTNGQAYHFQMNTK